MTEMRRSRSGRRLFVGGVVSMVASVAIVAGLLARKVSLVRAEGRARAADVAAGPHVRVARVTAPQGVQTLTLLGEARPYAAVTLYAKVSGYLRQILVDKGDAVGAGQVLAVIESPELDQQYEAALADARNKRVNADRFRALAKQNASSAQEAERYETDAAVAEANLKAIETLKSYEVIRAPFTGRVTVKPAAKGRGYPGLPAGALIVRGDTTLVAVVDSADRVAFRRVVVARDDGQSAQIAGGVAPGERVALNVGESVAEGARVQPVEQH